MSYHTITKEALPQEYTRLRTRLEALLEGLERRGRVYSEQAEDDWDTGYVVGIKFASQQLREILDGK